VKRIAMYIHHEVGGAVSAFHGFMRILRQQGYGIDLYRFNQAGESFLPLSKMADHTYDMPLSFRLPISSPLPLLREYVNTWRYWRNLADLDGAARRMAGEIDRHGYCLVFLHIDRLVKVPHLVRYLETPAFLYLEEPERRFYDPPSLFRDELDAEPGSGGLRTRLQAGWYVPARAIRARIWRSISDRNMRQRKRTVVLVNSYFTAEAVWRAYDLMPDVCYLGIDTNRFRPLVSPRDNYVLTVGSLTPNKGHAFLVRALAKLSAAQRPRFVVVADRASASRKRNLARLAEALEVDLDLRVMVSADELLSLYQKAKLFIYGSRLEPFGLAPLEAMAVGTPVIAVKSGGVRETVPDGGAGLLVDWDQAAFAHAIGRVLEDPNLWERLSAFGPGYVRRNWSWQRTLERFEQLAASHLGWGQEGSGHANRA
jgi:glycosyltransferase involved in cell wall biosynthesis